MTYVPLSSKPLLADLPQIAIPIGVTVVLAAYSIHLLQGETEVDRVKKIALYGWTGAVVGAFGAWWLLQQLQRELSVAILFDEVLTVVSIGSGLGVVLGAQIINQYSFEGHRNTSARPTDQSGPIAETVWTNEPGPNPIVVAITTQIADIEGVARLELDPLYEDIDPEVFAELRSRDESQWHLLFYTDKYEICVSSHGTVTIYETDSPVEGHETFASPRSDW